MTQLQGLEWPVLDHGFIRVVDVMGDDNAVVDAARVSYGGGTKPLHQNKALINYLMRHGHTSPFEQCEIKLHVKMPLFVARQWQRHRTANINEVSARYSVLKDEFYIPSLENIAQQSTNNHQGRQEDVENNDIEMASFVQREFKHVIDTAYESYRVMLDDGVAREIARMVLPLNIYTEFYWKIDLHNLLHFIRLRADKHAQYEIRAYAEKLLQIVQCWVPATYAAFMEYEMRGTRLSHTAHAVVYTALHQSSDGEKEMQREDWNISEREWTEMIQPLLQ